MIICAMCVWTIYIRMIQKQGDPWRLMPPWSMSDGEKKKRDWVY